MQILLLWGFQQIGSANLCGNKTGTLILMNISLRYDFYRGIRRMKLLDSNEIRQLRDICIFEVNGIMFIQLITYAINKFDQPIFAIQAAGVTLGRNGFHKRIYHQQLLIQVESWKPKERHSCRSFSLTRVIYYLLLVIPFLSSQHAEISLHCTFIKICNTYLVNNLSVLYDNFQIAIFF